MKILTREEIIEGRKRAQAIRQSYIQSAIDSGVPVTHTTTTISPAEQETIITTCSNLTIIDTTVPSDINRCIKRKYKIIALTYYNDRLVGATFKTSKSKITFRS